MIYEFLTSPAFVAYVAKYGIWGLTMPLYAVLIPAIVYVIRRR